MHWNLGWFRKSTSGNILHEIRFGIRFWLSHLFVFTAGVDSFLVLILTHFIFPGAALCIKVNLVKTRFRREKRLFLDKGILSHSLYEDIVYVLLFEKGKQTSVVLREGPFREMATSSSTAEREKVKYWLGYSGKSKSLIGIFWRHSMIFVPALAQYFLWLDIFMSP